MPLNQPEINENEEKSKALFKVLLDKFAQRVFPESYESCEWELTFTPALENRPFSFHLPSMKLEENSTTYQVNNNNCQRVETISKEEAEHLVAIYATLYGMEFVYQNEDQFSHDFYNFLYDIYHGVRLLASLSVHQIID